MSIRKKYELIEQQVQAVNPMEQTDWQQFSKWLNQIAAQYSERVELVGEDDMVQSVIEKIWERRSEFMYLSLEGQKAFALTVIFQLTRQWLCGSVAQSEYEHQRWNELAKKALQEGAEFEQQVLDRLSADVNVQKKWLAEGFLSLLGTYVSEQELQLNKAQILKELERAIEKTTEQEQLFLSLYYEQNMNYAQIAQIVELSGARVCQVLTKALGKIRLHLYQNKMLSS